MDPAPIEYLRCDRCGELMTYEALAGVTRLEQIKSAASYYLFRKWWPEKCAECGKRYGEHEDCLPF